MPDSSPRGILVTCPELRHGPAVEYCMVVNGKEPELLLSLWVTFRHQAEQEVRGCRMIPCESVP